MAISVPMPAQLVVREQSWAQSDSRFTQTAEFSSAEREIVTGPVARWTCDADIVVRTLDELVPVRRWLARMAMPGAYSDVPFGPAGGQQGQLPGASATCVVDGAGQAGYQVALRGLAPSVTHLRGGHLITVGIDLGRAVVSVLREDLVADATGRAVAQLSVPLSRAPGDGASVFLRAPFVPMRLPNPIRFMEKLYQLAELPTLNLRERW